MTQQITLIKDKILSDNYFTLHNITYDLTRKDGEVIRHKREVYDRGNGATILRTTRRKDRGSDSSVPCRYGLMAMKAGS